MGFWDKILGFLGVREELEEEEDEREEPVQVQEPSVDPGEAREAVETARRWGQGKRGQLVSIPGQLPQKLVVQEPLTFEEVQAVADHVKNRRPVVVCLDRVDRDLARKIVDFLSGTAYALDGKIQRVGEGIFLVVPSNVSIETDPRIELRQSRQQAAAAGSLDAESASEHRDRLTLREFLASGPQAQTPGTPGLRTGGTGGLGRSDNGGRRG
ncbi:MAG: cell division protein SepF [Limnochordales bacterium]|nr:cell division protein SepF [Limnochordales bacterium]